MYPLQNEQVSAARQPYWNACLEMDPVCLCFDLALNFNGQLLLPGQPVQEPHYRTPVVNKTENSMVYLHPTVLLPHLIKLTCFYSLAIAKGFSTSILPQSWMDTSLRGLSRPSVFVPSIFFTTSVPSKILPKTTCLPSNQGV